MSLCEIPIASSVPARYTFIVQQEKVSYDVSTQTELSFDDLVRNAALALFKPEKVLQEVSTQTELSFDDLVRNAALALVKPEPKSFSNQEIRTIINNYGPYPEPRRCIAKTMVGKRCSMNKRMADPHFCHHHQHTDNINKVDLILSED